MTRYSKRAKRNSRESIEGRIFEVRESLKSLKRREKYWSAKRTAFSRKVLKGIRKNIVLRTEQLNRYLARKKRWEKLGKI